MKPFPWYAIRNRNRVSVPIITGTVSVGSSLSCTPAASYQWQRADTIDGGGTFAPIAGATSQTYTVGPLDIGYDLRCVTPGGASNSLRYKPENVSAVIEVWKVHSLPNGALASWIGAKAGLEWYQANGSKQPTVGATSFNGGRGLSFDGSDDVMDGDAAGLDSFTSIRLVFGVQDSGASSPAGQLIFGTSVDPFNAAAPSTGGLRWDGAGRLASVGRDDTGTKIVSRLIAGADFSYPAVFSCALTPFTVGLFDFARQGAAALGYANAGSNQSTVDPYFADYNLRLAMRGGGDKWAGTLGGAFFLMPGSAVDADLVDAEAYVANATGIIL